MVHGSPLVSSAAQWLQACRAAGLEPAEVRLVLERYRAYRRYYAQGGRGEALPLAGWFSWYRMETASEVQQNSPTASGCSVDPHAVNRGAVARPAEFLGALQALARAEGDC
jgi:hypothetical protein